MTQSQDIRALVERLLDGADRMEKFVQRETGFASQEAVMMREAADALSCLAGEGWRPKVKPLDWTEQAIPPAGECLAYSPVGLYCIPLGGRAFCVRFRDKGEGDGPYPTLDAAKAAAQADFDRRILSALDLPAPSVEEKLP